MPSLMVTLSDSLTMFVTICIELDDIPLSIAILVLINSSMFSGFSAITLSIKLYSPVNKGIYSDFPAILNLSLLFPSSAPLRAGYDFTKYTKLPAIPGPNFALPLRLKPVKGLGLASLHGNKSVSVYDNCLPLFSKVNSVHSLKNITGKKVRIIGQPISLSPMAIAATIPISPRKKAGCILTKSK
jgi:hypothetical protein